MRWMILVLAMSGAAHSAAGQEKDVAALERAAAATPSDPRAWWTLAQAYANAGRRTEAVTALGKFTELAPTLPSGWFALGQAYNDIKRDAAASFGSAADARWLQLLAADSLLEKGQLIDAFLLYRESLEQLPAMASIHDSIARIYEQSGHADWAVKERAAISPSAMDCGRRKALCEFRAGRYQTSLLAALAQADPESRYWRARAANELAAAAFTKLDSLTDSVERRLVRATVARNAGRFKDAVAELSAAVKLAPKDEGLAYELGLAQYSARDYDGAMAALSPLLKAHPNEPRLLEQVAYSLLRLQRADEALPLLKRAADRKPDDPRVSLALGQAYLQTGDFAAAVPLIERQLGGDQDGSLHVQLARAYSALGQREKAATLLARSTELQRADQERSASAAARSLTPPK